MKSDTAQIRPGFLPTDNQKATELLGAALATVVALRIIAEYIYEADPTEFAERKVDEADRILVDAKLNAWALADIHGLNMDRVILSGQEDADKYLQHIGGDVTLWHEYQKPGYKEFRMNAVRSVNPQAEGDAVDAMFWSIIKAQ